MVVCWAPCPALQVDASRPPKRFLPFLTGLRSCIGQNLAKMNYTATLAVLLSRFSFQLPPEVSAARPCSDTSFLPGGACHDRLGPSVCGICAAASWDVPNMLL